MKVNLKLLFLVFILSSFYTGMTSEPQQELSEFSLSGYNQKGEKTWQIQGKSAQILEEKVLLGEVLGKYFGEKETVTITARRGEFNRKEGLLHLEENVIIDTSSGATLFTNSLDWDRDKEIIFGKEPVKLIRPSLIVEAKGIQAQPSLKKISLNEEIKVDIEQNRKNSSQKTSKIIITCDGPLEIDYDKNTALFKNNVKVKTQDNMIHSDEMEVYFESQEAKDQSSDALHLGFQRAQIKKIIARGNVKIIHGENISYAQEVIYDTQERKIILKGSPQLIISPEGKKNEASGN
ncbi:MAG: LPS export ABC transporter periplasmic protein LptC [Candidatus Omnitrophica bacterium]|nr:LPS export ABC transporter periplasmic protein LptC [Candidatus Omnitrophota bacterium]